jgi:CheY-like chemotaxis protein
MIKLQNKNDIVMVDDSELDIQIAKRCLRRSKVTNNFVGLLSAELLYDYLEAVKRREKAEPAIVLLDINMPGIDGYEALAHVRNDEFFISMPFIAIFSHSSLEADIQRAYSVGANGFRVKPLNLEEYVSFFDSLID